MKKPSFEDYSRLITFVAYKWHKRTGLDYEDLIAEGNLVFVRCAEDYNPELSRFSARLGHYLEQHYQNIVLTMFCKKRLGNIVEMEDHYQSSHLSPDKECMFREILEDLPEDAVEIVKALFDIPREIIDVLGITKITKNSLFRYFKEIKNWKQAKILNAFDHIQKRL